MFLALFIAALLFVTVPMLLASLYYWRQALVWRPREDIDGDTRRTALGMQYVYHGRPTRYWQHVRWNRKAYLKLFGALLVLALLFTSTAVLATLAPPYIKP